MTTETPQTEAPQVPQVAAEPGSRLEQLQAAYPAAKAAADEAAAQLKAITDAVKLELTQAAPEGSAKIELRGTDQAPALRLTYSESWRVDARKLKAEDPETYVRYAKKSGAWTLRPVAGGASE